MIATLLTTLFALGGLASICVLASSVQRHAPAFLALRTTHKMERPCREIRYTLVTTEVRSVVERNPLRFARSGFTPRPTVSRLAA